MTTNKITQKIIGYKVKSKDEERILTSEEVKELPAGFKITEIVTENVMQKGINEKVKRPEVIGGRTYKIKPSNSEHAFYITINNIVIDDKYHPFEIFINTKSIEQHKLNGFTRLISAIFRKGGDINFIIEELRQIYDPLGIYTSKRTYTNGKRKRFNSIEAEIGDIIEEHINSISNLGSEHDYDSKSEQLPNVDNNFIEEPTSTGFPNNATLCTKCNYKSVVIMDGCATCLNCGDSKCN